MLPGYAEVVQRDVAVWVSAKNRWSIDKRMHAKICLAADDVQEGPDFRTRGRLRQRISFHAECLPQIQSAVKRFRVSAFVFENHGPILPVSDFSDMQFCETLRRFDFGRANFRGEYIRVVGTYL